MARKVKKYEVEFEGRKTRVSVPSNEAASTALADALRDNLSPEAVVGIAACIVSADLIKKADVRKQVCWFRDFLVEMVGVDEYNRMIEEIGL